MTFIVVSTLALVAALAGIAMFLLKGSTGGRFADNVKVLPWHEEALPLSIPEDLQAAISQFADDGKRAIELFSSGKEEEALATLRNSVLLEREVVTQDFRTLARVIEKTDPGAAIPAYRHVLSLAPDDRAAKRDLADLLFRVGSLEDARTLNRDLLDAAVGARQRVPLLARLSEIAALSGDANEARALLNAAIEAVAPLNTAERTPAANIAIAQALETLSDGAAKKWYEDALQLSRDSHVKPAAALAETALARIALDDGRTDEAAIGFQRALAKWERLSDAPGVLEALLGLGNVTLDQEHPDIAIDYLRRAREGYHLLHDRIGEANAIIALARHAQKTGDDNTARGLRDEAAAIIETMAAARTPRLEAARAASARLKQDLGDV